MYNSLTFEFESYQEQFNFWTTLNKIKLVVDCNIQDDKVWVLIPSFSTELAQETAVHFLNNLSVQ